MADRQVGKSWGPWGSVALTTAVLAYLLIAPVCAHADSSVPSVQVSSVVPAGAQAAVSAAVAQASAAPVPAAAAAAVPAPARAAADAAVATAHVAAVSASAHVATAPAPQPAPSLPHVSIPSAPTPVVAPTVPHVNVPHITVPSVPLPSPQRATSRSPDPASSAATRAAQPAGSVAARLAAAQRRSGSRHASAKPSGRRPARPRTGASPPVTPAMAGHVIAASASVASAPRAGSFPPVHTARSPDRRRPTVLHRPPVRDIGITEASATAWPTVPTTAFLPPGGAGGPSAGGSGGAAGGIAAAVLALAALALLRGFLPGLLALDVVPWRSALLAFRLERPG